MKKLAVLLCCALLLTMAASCGEPKDVLLCSELGEAMVSFADVMYSSNLIAVVEAPSYVETVEAHGVEHKRYVVSLNRVLRGKAEEGEEVEVLEAVDEEGGTRLERMEAGKDYLLLVSRLAEGYTVFADRCIYEVPEYGVPVADVYPKYALRDIENVFEEKLEGIEEDITAELVLKLKAKLKEWNAALGYGYREELEWEILSYDYRMKGSTNWAAWESPHPGRKKYAHWIASVSLLIDYEDVKKFGEKGLFIYTNRDSWSTGYCYIYDFKTDTMLMYL